MPVSVLLTNVRLLTFESVPPPHLAVFALKVLPLTLRLPVSSSMPPPAPVGAELPLHHQAPLMNGGRVQVRPQRCQSGQPPESIHELFASLTRSFGRTREKGRAVLGALFALHFHL